MNRIDGKTLMAIVPSAGKNLAPGTAIITVRTRYCSRVHAVGRCTGDCETNCRNRLESMFSRLNHAEDVRSYVSLLTWLARNESTVKSEEPLIEEQIPDETDAYGHRTHRNPFLILKEQFTEA